MREVWAILGEGVGLRILPLEREKASAVEERREDLRIKRTERNVLESAIILNL